MVIAALISFGILLVAWVIAPDARTIEDVPAAESESVREPALANA